MDSKKSKKFVTPPPPPTGIAHIITDPFGSYTGLVPRLEEKPAWGCSPSAPWANCGLRLGSQPPRGLGLTSQGREELAVCGRR